MYRWPSVKRARIVIARDGKKSLLGRDWFTQLNFRVVESSKEDEYTNIVNSLVNKIEMSPELKRIQQRIAYIFSRQ